MNCKSCSKKIKKDSAYCEECGTANHYFKESKGIPVFLRIFRAESRPRSILFFLLLITIVIFAVFGARLWGWILAIICIAAALLAPRYFKNIPYARKLNLPVAVILIVIIFIAATSFNTPGGGITAGGSSIVSKELAGGYLGNITNGQFYFNDGKNIYYSSFDRGGAAHIYKKSLKSGEATPIFDGFGWSLVVIDDWLYFSGNEGAAIDGSYNLFRIKTDGSKLERLNSIYSYGMNIYNSWIYYLRKSASGYNNELDICRCDLEGKNEEIIDSGMISSMFIFKDRLYYLKSDNIIMANPDGSGVSVLPERMAKGMATSGDKIIFITPDKSIAIMDATGSNLKEIPVEEEGTLWTINAYKDKIYYALYDANFDYSRLGYRYSVYRMNLDGSAKRKIYDSISYGVYINITDGRVFALDYAQDTELDIMTAVAIGMELDGKNPAELTR